MSQARPVKQSLLALLFTLAVAGITNAYVLEGQHWNSSPVSMQMNLSATSYRLQNPPRFPLFDGATSWDGVYAAAAAVWNPYMTNMKIRTYSSNNSAGGQTGDGVNEAFFGSSLGGSTLDSNTLGLTIYSYDPNTNFMVEADTAFNPSSPWNSYRGPLLSNGVVDFRRVAIHELGHILGLDHPDTNGQTVNAIMNSVISNTDTVTADDIAGVQALYGAAVAPPVTSHRVAKDFNGDGQADLILEDTVTGQRAIWILNKGQYSNGYFLPSAPAQWHIAGAADFLGNGQTDLVWENLATGERGIWILNDGVYSYSIVLPSVPTQWQIVGAADFLGTGQAGLVWENTATGERGIWILKNGAYSYSIALPSAPTQWHIAGAADFLGTGQAGLVWEDTMTGERGIWILKNGAYSYSIALPSAPTQWHIAGAADFLGTGQAGLVWEDTATGARGIWILNNGSYAYTINLPTVSTDWKIVDH
jgi:hypothetical protein